MRFDGISVHGTGVRLCEREEVREAVRSGRYDADACAADDLVSISVAREGEYPPDMAVEASRAALDRASAVSPRDVGLVVYAGVGHPGLDHFAPASYLQGRLLGHRGAMALEVSQMSNSGMAALELAAAHLLAASEDAAAVVTTSEKFALPLYDRYRMDDGIILADGATALVLSRRPGGLARLVSSVSISDPTHEAFWRGRSSWTDAPDVGRWPIELGPRKSEYLEDGVDLMSVMVDIDKVQMESMERATAEAGTRIGDIDWFVFPHVGSQMFDWDLYASMGIDRERTTWEWGRRVGHLGGGDQAAGLNHLLTSGAAAPGQRIALVGTGGGWSFGCAVLEVL